MNANEDRLAKYRLKRDFRKTGEPQSSRAGRSGIYVIQEHLARRLHYDLRLEHGGVLLSWAVPKGPSTGPGQKRLAVHVEDHPVDYAEFEGEIPEGSYGGGTVRIWDRGTWTPDSDVDQALAAGKLTFTLNGERLHGKWVLVRMHGEDDDKNWLLIKEHDDPATAQSRGPRDEEEWAFQLCIATTKPPEGSGWLREIKWDGYRAMAIVAGGACRLVTRGGNDLSIPHLQTEIEAVAGDGMTLDGEIVALDADNRSDFGALQRQIKADPSELRFVAFDLLLHAHRDLRDMPLSGRRRGLEKILDGAAGSLMLSPEIPGEAAAVFRSACEMGLEGIVSKRLDSVYSGIRSADWIKTKCRRRAKATVGGYTLMKGNSMALGAILVGNRKGDSFIFEGRIGTGFSDLQRTELRRRLSLIETEESPFTGITAAEAADARWVVPKLEVQFEYLEYSENHRLRQASFMGVEHE